MRTKKSQTSLSFLVLIIKMYQHARVSHDEMKYIKVTPTSFIDICKWSLSTPGGGIHDESISRDGC